MYNVKRLEKMKKTDRNAILEWAEKTGADEQTQARIKAALDDMDALDVINSVNVEQALHRTERRIRNQKRTLVLRFGLLGAAVSAAACMAVFLFLQILHPSVREPLYSELKVNPGMTGTFVMPDSTVVVLNGGSSLSYSSSYDRKSREVTLAGEAYFDVVKDADVPFIVNTPSNSSVRVYGTQFNVDAYGPEECRVSLVNGSVGFRYTGQYGQTNEVMMEPGQRLVYDTDSGCVEVQNVSVKSDIAWKDGKMILDGTPLSDILDILSKRYSVAFDVQDEDYLKYTYSGGAFKVYPLEKVLETLQYTSSIRWKYDDNAASDRKQTIIIY